MVEGMAKRGEGERKCFWIRPASRFWGVGGAQCFVCNVRRNETDVGREGRDPSPVPHAAGGRACRVCVCVCAEEELTS